MRILTLALPLAALASILIAPSAHAETRPEARRLVDRLEASVNAQAILHSDLKRFRATLPLRAQLDPLFAGSTVAEKGTAASDADITEALLQDLLTLAAFPVSDAEVEQEILSIQANNKIDRSRLKGALSQQGFAFEDYFELIRLSTSKRNLIDREIRTRVAISDDDVRSHYASRQTKGSEQDSKTYRIRLLVLNRKNYKSESALKETSERALAALKSGDKFEEVVTRYGDDSAKESGGDLGYVSGEQISPEIRAALKGLREGGVSGVFGNAKSRLMILQLVATGAGEDSGFAKAKDEIRNQLAAAEYQHQIELWMSRQKVAASIHRAAALNP